MENGIRKRKYIIGAHLPDPFFDSYKEEALECCEIMDLVGKSQEDSITLTFGKAFLKKLVKSHILFIKEIEKHIAD